MDIIYAVSIKALRGLDFEHQGLDPILGLNSNSNGNTRNNNQNEEKMNNIFIKDVLHGTNKFSEFILTSNIKKNLDKSRYKCL